MSAPRHITPLAVALFEAYSRNCGHSPDGHFDRNAAEQWMTQALDECGVAELIEDLKRIQRRAVEHQDDNDADRKRNLYHIKSIADSALARVSGEPA